MVCKDKNDPFIQDKPIWFVTLKTGKRIYQDDGRPGEEVSSAWLRLKEYCDRTGEEIETIGLKFRSHIVENFLPRNCSQFYFCKSIVGNMEDTKEFYIVGHRSGNPNVFFRYWFAVPELELVKSEQTNRSALFEEAIIINGKRKV
jgi:hypothetical protein